jgi:SSS family solute:Na+ symporter
LQVVIGALGISGKAMLGDAPLIIAFLMLAAFTYVSGLRAPAAIAIVKDILIFVTVFASIVIIPIELGGYTQIFASIPLQKLLLPVPQGNTTGAYTSYATLALGSALSLFLYPHSATAILSASSGHAIRRNAAMLPAYSLLLGLLALLGFMAIAAGVDKMPEYIGGFRQFQANFAVPALMLHVFPSWFAGVALAAIGIGALVPAAIMSIAAANLFTRNLYREFWRPDCTHREESQMAKWVSLVVKVGALLFILGMPQPFAIQLQLLGGIWMIQTLPPVIFGLYTRRLNAWALLVGWAVGIGLGTSIAVKYSFTSIWPVVIAGYSFPGYTALYTLIINVLIAVVLTPVFNAMAQRTKDETVPADYRA